jgi:hypothetical protein
MAIARGARRVLTGIGLALLAAPFALFALLCGAITCLYLSTVLGPPAHASIVSVPDLNATIKLEFYMVWDETQESGRFITASTPRGSVHSKIEGFDWLHNARTSIYETPQHDVAVLGPTALDYIIHLQTLELTTLSPFASSVGWKYIGAFDFGGPSHTLQFFPASQEAECIPMRTSRDEYWPKMSRAEYRKEDCYRGS